MFVFTIFATGTLLTQLDNARGEETAYKQLDHYSRMAAWPTTANFTSTRSNVPRYAAPHESGKEKRGKRGYY